MTAGALVQRRGDRGVESEIIERTGLRDEERVTRRDFEGGRDPHGLAEVSTDREDPDRADQGDRTRGREGTGGSVAARAAHAIAYGESV